MSTGAAPRGDAPPDAAQSRVGASRPQAWQYLASTTDAQLDAHRFRLHVTHRCAHRLCTSVRFTIFTLHVTHRCAHRLGTSVRFTISTLHFTHRHAHRLVLHFATHRHAPGKKTYTQRRRLHLSCNDAFSVTCLALIGLRRGAVPAQALALCSYASGSCCGNFCWCGSPAWRGGACCPCKLNIPARAIGCCRNPVARIPPLAVRLNL